jgi:hypothetical protein
MKFHAPILAAIVATTAHAAELPKIFKGLLEKDIPIRGQIGIVLPPPEIDEYVAKVEAAARLDPKWFREFSEQGKPGAPLPFHEKLGLTKEEYEEYLKLWAQREFKPNAEVMLLLREGSGGTWSVTATGDASSITTLRYDPKTDVFRSPNGELKRIDDINAPADSILGAWTGMEWKFEETTTLGKTKENLAYGRMAGDKFGLIVYRFQEISSEGTRLLDRSLVIRFALGKAGHLQRPATPGQPPAAPNPR